MYSTQDDCSGAIRDTQTVTSGGQCTGPDADGEYLTSTVADNVANLNTYADAACTTLNYYVHNCECGECCTGTIAGTRVDMTVTCNWDFSTASPTPASPAPTVSVLKVTGVVTLDGYTAATFGTAQKTAFATAMANIAGVSASDVTVTVEDARRRLLAGVKLTYEINTADAASAATLQATIKSKSGADVVSEMRSAGLD
jgi:hypothetical protein